MCVQPTEPNLAKWLKLFIKSVSTWLWAKHVRRVLCPRDTWLNKLGYVFTRSERFLREQSWVTLSCSRPRLERLAVPEDCFGSSMLSRRKLTPHFCLWRGEFRKVCVPKIGSRERPLGPIHTKWSTATSGSICLQIFARAWFSEKNGPAEKLEAKS